jgi:tRNA (mo5U34)-methyltransferase
MPTQQVLKKASLDEPEIRRKLSTLGEWFHNIDLNGIQTAPDHFLGNFPSIKWERLQQCLPSDLTGKSVLDIGCNGGFYSIELKKRGASRVLAIDPDTRYLNQARFAAEVHQLDIEFQPMSVYDVGSLSEKFDIVLFMGVLYHLRYPLLALDLLAKHVAKDILVFQTLTRGSKCVQPLEDDYPFSEAEIFNRPEFPVLHFIEKSYSADPTNWWIPNRACSEAMLRSAGFTIEAQADDDTFVCRQTPSPDAAFYLEELRKSVGNL